MHLFRMLMLLIAVNSRGDDGDVGDYCDQSLVSVA